ncbi:hypothetical protein EK904_013840 [Melospiza melodia maxima]|nr:hypothetical protein EK904_013840 [Melospiza melodia maxima]
MDYEIPLVRKKRSVYKTVSTKLDERFAPTTPNFLGKGHQMDEVATELVQIFKFYALLLGGNIVNKWMNDTRTGSLTCYVFGDDQAIKKDFE